MRYHLGALPKRHPPKNRAALDNGKVNKKFSIKSLLLVTGLACIICALSAPWFSRLGAPSKTFVCSDADLLFSDRGDRTYSAFRFASTNESQGRQVSVLCSNQVSIDELTWATCNSYNLRVPFAVLHFHVCAQCRCNEDVASRF